MRRLLILGGTAWLGAEVARQAVAAGDHVTCLARGASGGAPDGVTFVHADRSLPGALDHVEGEWDAVIELAYEPAVVSAALEAFADRAAHWSLVSTISVYASNAVAGADETAALLEPVDLEEYGQAKVAAERLAQMHVDGRLLVTRPGLIAGPGDTSDRFGYWPARLARGGRALAPELAGHVQVIDVADLAAWLLRSSEAGLTGVADAVGEPVPMREFFDMAAAVAGFDGELVEVPHDWLRQQGVMYWAGPRSLPLWLPEADAAMAQRSGKRFTAMGGALRPMAETLERVLADEAQRGLMRVRRSGLTPAEESELLALLR